MIEAGAARFQTFPDVTSDDGNETMVMKLMLDLGIEDQRIIRIPFEGTTGTVTVPEALANPTSAKGAAQAGPLKSGESLSGRIGDFNEDCFIDGTLVAVGLMPLTSPLYPIQPFAMSRNFETDIPIAGAHYGSPRGNQRGLWFGPGRRARESRTENRRRRKTQ